MSGSSVKPAGAAKGGARPTGGMDDSSTPASAAKGGARPTGGMDNSVTPASAAKGGSARAGSLFARRALCLLGAYLVSGLLFTLLWWPILLAPLHSLLPIGALGGIVGLLPFLALRPPHPAGQERGRSARRQGVTLYGALFLGFVLAAMHVLAQIVLIRRKPFLTLAQYMREDLWVLWIGMALLGLAYALLLRLWDRPST